MYKSNRGTAKQNWDEVWLEEYRRFLKLEPGEVFSVETQVVISFLIELKRRGKKAWQRLQALRAIRSFAGQLRLPTEHLDDVAAKLKTLVDREKAEAVSAADIKEVAGRIDPNEPEIVQRLRRKIRLKHQALNTEMSCVKYINQFIHRFKLRDDPEWSRVSRFSVRN